MEKFKSESVTLLDKDLGTWQFWDFRSGAWVLSHLIAALAFPFWPLILLHIKVFQESLQLIS
jgi:hypothetical protein